MTTKTDETKLPRVGSKWTHKGCKRVITVTAVDVVSNRTTIAFRYEKTTGDSGRNWRRGVAPPVQVLLFDSWKTIFTKEVKS